MESFVILYLGMSALYSYYYSVKINNPNVSVLTYIMFGTTFSIHIIFTLLAFIYQFFGVNISYMVSLRAPELDEDDDY